MSYLELIAAIASKTGCTKTEARKVLQAFVDVSEKVLADKGRIVLPGFGVLFVQDKPYKTGPLFGGTRVAGGPRIKFRQSRRGRSDG